MEIEYDPANFEVIFNNRFTMIDTYFFVYFDYPRQEEPPFVDEHGNQFSLNILNSSMEKYSYESKPEFIRTASNFSAFNRSLRYLYKHNGEFGYYDFKKGTFNRFNADITNRVYKFYYNDMSL